MFETTQEKEIQDGVKSLDHLMCTPKILQLDGFLKKDLSFAERITKIGLIKEIQVYNCTANNSE